MPDMMQSPLPLVDVPRARVGDPVTSHTAARRIKDSGALGKHQRAVLSVVQRYPGHTSAELAERLTGHPDLAKVADLYHEAARRLPELHPVHVRKGAARVCSVRGALCQTWYPA